MTPDQWRRVKETFDVAVETDPAGREAWLHDACATEPDIEREVRRMLAATGTLGPLDAAPIDPAELGRVLAGLDSAFEAGETLAGRFRIERFLGRGGMGEVWEAFDTELRESIALKTVRAEGLLLDPQSVDRFKREVQRARQVAHVNVCRVYDLFFHGELPFLTMELVAGETLADRLQRDGRLSEAEALPILQQCAAGLAAAHAAGLIHRDFKPGNVMLAGERAVVTDFGLAQVSVPRHGSSVTAGGTPAYMAPEQAAGGAVTAAADIYSLGVVICEVLSGKRPSDGGLAGLPSTWRPLILRALHPDPGSRQRSPHGLFPSPARRRLLWSAAAAVALGAGTWTAWRMRTPPSVALPDRSIAVLPFAAPEAGNLGDLISEELITSLTRLRELRVVARTASQRFAGTRSEAGEVARQLKTRYLVSGTVQRNQGRLRVSVQLVDGQTGAEVWADIYDRPEREILDTERQIARTLAAQLGVQPAATAIARPLAEGGAAYLNGRYHLNRRFADSVRRAVGYLEEAIRLAPEFPEAHAALAEAMIVLAEIRQERSQTAIPRARSLTARALLLDPRLAEAHACHGFLASAADHNFQTAERDFLRAIELNPQLVLARQWYAYMLIRLSRFGEAKQQALQAIELDPLSMPAQQNLAMVYYYSRNWPALRAVCGRLLELDPNHFFAHLLLAYTAAARADTVEAKRLLDLAERNAADRLLFARMATEVYVLAKAPSLAATMLERVLKAQPAASYMYQAVALAAVGRVDDAFPLLEKAWDEQDLFLPMLAVYPAFDSLRRDPRYFSLLDRLGLKAGTALDSTPPR